MKFLLALLLSFSAHAALSPASPSAEPQAVINHFSFFSPDVKVETINLEDFKEDEERFKKIAKNVEFIINSSEFKELVLGHVVTPLSRKGFYDVSDMLKMSNEEAFDTMMNGDWKLNYIRYCSSKSTVGYTYPSVSWIKINSCHSNYKSDELVAQNICHEYGGHKRGFRHNSSDNKYRPYSFPYAVGAICKSLYVKHFGANSQPVKTYVPWWKRIWSIF